MRRKFNRTEAFTTKPKASNCGAVHSSKSVSVRVAVLKPGKKGCCHWYCCKTVGVLAIKPLVLSGIIGKPPTPNIVICPVLFCAVSDVIGFCAKVGTSPGLTTSPTATKGRGQITFSVMTCDRNRGFKSSNSRSTRSPIIAGSFK